MQTKGVSGSWVRVTFALALLLTLAVLLQPAVSHAAPLGADTVVYVVKPGDTLRSIAAAHGTTIGAIVRANNMANPDVIYPGQRLTIPVRGGSAPDGGPCADRGRQTDRRRQRLSYCEVGRYAGQGGSRLRHLRSGHYRSERDHEIPI